MSTESDVNYIKRMEARNAGLRDQIIVLNVLVGSLQTEVDKANAEIKSLQEEIKALKKRNRLKAE